MCYGAVAAFGITVLRNFLTSQQFWLRFVGGLFLIFLGVRAFLARPAAKAVATPGKRGLLGAYLSTLGLTLTNPATIISFTFIFAGLRLGQASPGYLGAALLVSGVFLGSAAWWFMLSGLVGFFREPFTPIWMCWVNRIAGLILCGFGVAALALT